MIKKKYTVDRITDGKVILLDREDESIQVVMNVNDFPPVKEGDIVDVSWTSEVGAASYTTILEDETKATRERIKSKLDKLKNKGK